MIRMAVVLAAGEGKRMKSNLYKVLHPVCGKAMIGHVVSMLEGLNFHRIIGVVGHGAESVKEYLGNRLEYVLQQERLGTGHAVLQTEPVIGQEEGLTLVICGDTPLVKGETIRQMIELHERSRAAVTILTARVDEPHGYGRVIRGENGDVARIVEEKDCTPKERLVNEINAGTYCFDNRKLFRALKKLTNDNAQGEYYLTDCIGILKREGERIEAYCTDDPAEAVGVNDRVALAEAEKTMRMRINCQHMQNGVTIVDPEHTYIEADVKIGPDTTILPGTFIKGHTHIGARCVIGPHTEIADSYIADGVRIRHSVLTGATVGEETSVGPFAYLRPGTVLGRKVKIGDFVEIKNASLDDGSKVSHLSYVGDAKVGKSVNIGCGAITVNYDGFQKHLTEIGDDAFIGSNVNLIAPVKIGKGAYVVAGSTITHDVGENDLAIARERQTNKPKYADILRKRKKAAMEKKQGSPPVNNRGGK